MREARKYQLGPYAERGQAYLESLASATACLLDPGQKGGYDEELRRRYGLPEIAVTSTYLPGDAIPITPIPASARAARAQRGRWKLVPSIVLGILVLAGAAAHWMIPTTVPERVVSNPQVQNEKRESSPPPHAVAAVNPLPATATPHPATVKRHPAADLPDRRAPVNRELAVTGDGANEPAPADQSHETAPIGYIPASSADLPDPGPSPGFESPPADSGTPRSGGEPTGISRTASRNAARARSPSKAAPTARPPAHRAAGSHKHAAGHPYEDLAMTSADVLRELRAFRLKRNPAQHLSSKPHALSTRRIEQLVRYARAAFAGDRGFQRRLDHETTALRRLDPKLKQLLPDSHR
jgi:hypothetical protein